MLLFRTYWGGRLSVLLALALFTVASLLGLLTPIIGRTSKVTARDTLQAMIDTHWTDDEADARNQITYLNVLIIGNLRDGNSSKAKLVEWGIVLQLMAIVVLVGTLALELRTFA
jgi:hypothetical protein